MMSLEAWRTGIVEAAAKTHAKQIQQFDLIPTLELDCDPQLRRNLVRARIWALQKPDEVLKAVSDGSKFYVVVGLRPSRLHIGHLTLAREVAMWVSFGGHPIFVVSTFDGQSGARQEPKQVVSVLWTRIRELLSPQVSVEPVIVVDAEDPAVVELERNVAKHLKIGKIKQLYGWQDDMDLLQARTPAFMAATFLLPYYALDAGCPVVALVDVHQLAHAEAARIASLGLGVKMPCFSYRVLLQALNGPDKRMSTKDKASVAYLDDPEATLRKVLKSSFSGGLSSVEDQRRLGGRPEACSFFHAAETLLLDTTADTMLADCSSGRLLCGECKKAMTDRCVTAIRMEA